MGCTRRGKLARIFLQSNIDDWSSKWQIDLNFDKMVSDAFGTQKAFNAQ